MHVWQQKKLWVQSTISLASKNSNQICLFCSLNRPHDPEANRNVPLMVEELLEPIPVEPRAAMQPQDFFKYRNSGSVQEDSLYASRDEALSKTSVLNKRKPLDDQLLSKSSALNVRYVEQRRVSDHQRPKSPVPPASPALSAEGRQRGPGSQSQPSPPIQSPSTPPLSSTSNLNRRYSSKERLQDQDKSSAAQLAGSKLNQRYSATSQTNEKIPNGHLVNGDADKAEADLAAESALNRR